MAGACQLEAGLANSTTQGEESVAAKKHCQPRSKAGELTVKPNIAKKSDYRYTPLVAVANLTGGMAALPIIGLSAKRICRAPDAAERCVPGLDELVLVTESLG
jgi:hypothetical protein